MAWPKGKHHTEETKRKMRESSKGTKHSEETRKKMSKAKSGDKNPFWGKHHSEETRKKMSKAQKGKNHYLWGKHHSEQTKRKMGKSRSGEKHWNWNGGITINNQYVFIYSPDHPFSTKRGYVREARLVAEKELGRYLTPKEITHHRNGKRDDNKWENLFVFESKPDHQKYERFLRRK